MSHARPLRLLVLASSPPYPLTDGGRIAIFEPLRRLAARGHTIELLTFGGPDHPALPAPPDGAIFGRPWTRAQRLRRVATSLVWPVKVAVACLGVARGARRAGLLREFVLTRPVIVAGQTAWVLGASLRYWPTDAGSALTASRPRHAFRVEV